jgi:amino acid adenylation domain-containing protein
MENETVHGRVRAQALSTPDGTALVQGTRRVTYAELDRLAEGYAAQLAALGVRQGDFLPVRLPRSVRLVGVILGALRLGAAYALLDSAWPDERVHDELDQLRAKLFVTDVPSGSAVPTWSPPESPDPAGAPDPVTVRDADPCAVFFTSGTTGRPKGAVSPHRGVIRLADPGSALPLGPDTVIAHTAAMPWDLFSFELWAPLMTGGTVVLIEEPYLSGNLIRALVARDGLNTTWATTTLFNMLVDEDPDCFCSLRTVMVGGERLSPPHVRAFLNAHPGIALINGYGPVEATVFASTRLIRPGDCDVEGGIPIGTPVPRTRAYVLDGERRCADGELGELCFAGDGLAIGYLGDPELTARKFPTLHGERMYRTGDLGFRDAGGVLHYRGRIDRQLKVRGHRIEPVEVEAVLGRLPGIARAVVLPRLAPDGRCTGMLAFYVPTGPTEPESLLARMRTLVPAYQVPDRLIQVERIPLLANGKLDPAALLAMVPEGPSTVESRAAADPLTETVAGVVAAIVGLAPQRVPLDATLTALGASSLDAGRVAARLGDLLGRPVPLSQVFRTPTVASLAGWIRDSGLSERAAEPDPDGPGALSGMQAYMFMEHVFDPDGLGYHCVFSWRIAGRPDRKALRYAVDYVHRRHPMLSSVYSLGDPPVAQPADLPAPPLREFLVETEEQARVLLGRELARPFRLEKGDVWQAVFVAVREAPVTLFGVAVHHVAFDGGSAAPLGADLAHAYRAFRAGTAPDQPPAPGPARIAAARDAHLRYVDLPAQREYWRRTVAGLPALVYPGPPDTVAAGPVAPMVERPLPAGLVRGLGELAVRYAVSPFVVYLTGYGQALAELTGQHDLGIGTSFNRRGHSVLAGAVACLIDVLCLRMRPRSGAPMAEAFAATAAVVSGAFAAQDVTVYEVARLLDTPAPPDRIPLFQNMFLFQDNVPALLALDGMDAQIFRPPYPGVPSEVVAEIWPAPDGTARLVIGYRPERVPGAFCEALADRYTALLEEYVRVP